MAKAKEGANMSVKAKTKEPASAMYKTTYDHDELGTLTIASDGEHIIGLWIEGQKYFASTVTDDMVDADDLPVLQDARQWLARYFAGEKPDPNELPLAPRGSSFRQRVWKKLLEIPYGQTTTYGRIASELAHEDGKERMSAQAVGGAVGHNPISVIIPCHRVVGADGSLTGYAGGIDKKVKLLTLEGALSSEMYVPTRGTAL